MAIHSKTEGMLKESLEEMLIAAGLCIKFEKKNKGCLGYPATILLLSIVDTIGSYYEGNKNFKIKIDGKDSVINGVGFQHFYILNSDYYNLQLSGKTIKKIYNNYRSLLVHNGVIPNEHFIIIDDSLCRCFSDDAIQNSITGKHYPCIFLKPLFKTSRFAVDKFIEQIDKVVPISKQARIIAKRTY